MKNKEDRTSVNRINKSLDCINEMSRVTDKIHDNMNQAYDEDNEEISSYMISNIGAELSVVMNENDISSANLINSLNA
jgi:hypothetical protein